MLATRDLKRQNFNVTPEQEADLLRLQALFAAPSAKDAILRAVRLTLILSQEVKKGKRICLSDKNGELTEIILPEFESGSDKWIFLVERSHSWKKQLFVKGRKVTAAQIWLDMQANKMNDEEAAENWDIPLEAIAEIEAYCKSHLSLLQMEADEEKLTLSRSSLRAAP